MVRPTLLVTTQVERRKAHIADSKLLGGWSTLAHDEQVFP